MLRTLFLIIGNFKKNFTIKKTQNKLYQTNKVCFKP